MSDPAEPGLAPLVIDAEEKPLIKQEVEIREVLIPTPSRAGDGPEFAHSLTIDYANPITAVF